jgi:hypothetical protein
LDIIFPLAKEEELFFFGRQVKLCYIIKDGVENNDGVQKETEKPFGTCQERVCCKCLETEGLQSTFKV